MVLHYKGAHLQASFELRVLLQEVKGQTLEETTAEQRMIHFARAVVIGLFGGQLPVASSVVQRFQGTISRIACF